jgi:hypothetical protein
MKDDLTVDCGDTKFRVEKRPMSHDKIWSGRPEICIAHILNDKRSRFGPSIPLDRIPELIGYLEQAYQEMNQDLVRQQNEPDA